MIEIDRFFDIETSDWVNFGIGGVITAGTLEYFDTTDEEEFFWHLIAPHSGTTWCWNGGKFDMLWLIGMARKLRHTTSIDLTCQISTAGPRVTSVKLGGVLFRDSVAICPMSLQQAALIAGIEMSKDTGVACTCDCLCKGEDGEEYEYTLHSYDVGPTDEECPNNCGGYCGVKPELLGMDPEEKKKFIQYLYEDNLSGLKIMEALIEEANRCDYDLTGTIGGSSFKTAKRRLKLEPVHWKTSLYTLARSAYFGGRVEVFRPTAESGHAYDINSAYPFALSVTKLPTGEMLECSGEKAQRAFNRGKEGLYFAKCIVPKMFVPPLPVRLSSGRVAFPIGEIYGIWPAIELREAMSLGCEVTITGGLVWADSEIVFKDFMTDVWNNRLKNKANKGLYKWHKWFANSLTGKLAEKPEKERIVMYPPADKIKWCPGGKCSKACRGKDPTETCAQSRCCDLKHRSSGCDAWRMLDLNATLYLAPFWRISECAYVHWAAYLTAAARIQLGRELRNDGADGAHALYCDTDSVYSSHAHDTNIGGELGQWGYDGAFYDWLALAPKLYRYSKDELVDGKTVQKDHVRAKGLSEISRQKFDDFHKGETIVNDRGVKAFKSACKDVSGETFVRKRLERTNRSDGIHFGSRVLNTKDGKTYPQTLEQLFAWEADLQRN